MVQMVQLISAGRKVLQGASAPAPLDVGRMTGLPAAGAAGGTVLPLVAHLPAIHLGPLTQKMPPVFLLPRLGHRHLRVGVEHLVDGVGVAAAVSM